MPTAAAASAPSAGSVKGRNWHWVKAGVVSMQSTLFYVRADMGASEQIAVTIDELLGPPIPELPIPPLDPAAFVLRVTINGEVQDVQKAGETSRSAAHVTELWHAWRHGFLTTVYVTHFADQEEKDVQGTVTWSDRTTQAQTAPCVIEIANLASDFATLTTKLTILDGESRPFYGTIGGSGLPPVVFWIDGDADATRLLPLPAGWRDIVNRTRIRAPQADLLEVRPLSNLVDTGSTGFQPCFGLQKGLLGIGDNENVQEMRWSAMDYILRGHHHLDLGGAPLDQNADGRKTWAAYPWRVTGACWGKPNSDPPFGNFRAFIDDQHRGGLPVWATLAATHDEILHDELRFLLAADLGRAKRGQFDAARASGRLLKDWAAMFLATSSQDARVSLKQLAMEELAVLEARVAAHPGPMPVTDTLDPADTKNPCRGSTTWAPWQECEVIAGAGVWGLLLNRLGQTADAGRFFTLASKLAVTVVTYGILPTSGGLVTVGYSAWFPDGPPAGFYDLPRPGCTTYIPSLTQPPADLILGGISPFWYASAIQLAALENNPKGLAAMSLIAAPRDIYDLEWLV